MLSCSNCNTFAKKIAQLKTRIKRLILLVLKQEVNFRMLWSLLIARISMISEASDKRIQNISWYLSLLRLKLWLDNNKSNQFPAIHIGCNVFCQMTSFAINTITINNTSISDGTRYLMLAPHI